MYMSFRAHIYVYVWVSGPTTVCVYVWRVKEIERAVMFTLPPPFYFTARTLLYRPVHRTNKKSTPRWKVRNTRLRYIKSISYQTADGERIFFIATQPLEKVIYS